MWQGVGWCHLSVRSIGRASQVSDAARFEGTPGLLVAHPHRTRRLNQWRFLATVLRHSIVPEDHVYHPSPQWQRESM